MYMLRKEWWGSVVAGLQNNESGVGRDIGGE